MVLEHILSITIFFPILGALALFLVNKENAQAIKLIGFFTSALTFVISLYLYLGFDAAAPGFQFKEYELWVPSLNIGYYVGIDGMSLLLIVLTTFLTPIALLGTWNSIEHKLRGYTMMILLLEVGMVGVFSSLDLLFSLFMVSITEETTL